jgi:anti-sigma regulatory factor (Ser/Thr protein kinase)
MLPTAPALTLIPYSEGGHTLDSSVRYSTEDVTVALRRIERFLLDQGIDKSVVFSVMLCCEELMVNIVQHSTGHIVSHTFDVHVFVKDGLVQIAIKDGGRPFDPIARGKAAKLKLVDNDIPDLGVSIAANIVSDISYKYMYGQNMVLIKV